jgi:hypothetical protein
MGMFYDNYNMSIQKLHSEHNLYPELKDFHLIFGFDRKTKQFKFLGYMCNKCSSTLKNVNLLPRHNYNCSKGPRKEHMPETIIDNERNIWRSMKFKHKIDEDTLNDKNTPKT